MQHIPLLVTEKHYVAHFQGPVRFEQGYAVPFAPDERQHAVSFRPDCHRLPLIDEVLHCSKQYVVGYYLPIHFLLSLRNSKPQLLPCPASSQG